MKQGRQARKSGMAGFLARLGRDRRGNVLALVAAALVPLAAMIGSGIDLSRAYMAKNRLQQACDAGALAGRRVLTTPAVTDAVTAEVNKYLDFNFPEGTYSTKPFTPTISVPQAGTVRVIASTRIDTTVMSMFGFVDLPIDAECQATQDFINTDVMLVFDLSGSMNCPPGTAGACGEVNQPGSKLDALKDAAKALYTTLEPAQKQLADNNLRLRYGFVNYSSAVNVGAAVYAKNTDYFAKRWTYQSRVYGRDAYDQTQAWCDAQGGYRYWARTNNGNRWRCVWPTNSNPTVWYYQPVEHDVTSYLAGGTPYVQAIQSNTSKWSGCIEERATDSTAINGGTSTGAPTNAYDLDVNLIPSSDATRWKPYWDDIEYYRNHPGSGSSAASYCPTAAKRLATYNNNQAGFNKYVNDLTAIGGTYHDIGMIWGARFISPDGIFRASPEETNDNTVADNAKKIRGFGVRRYIIFMTDGDMAPTGSVYSPYGIEDIDGRVTAGANNQLDRHLQRFRIACNQAKRVADVYVIAFSTTLTSDMENCATQKSYAAGITSKDALIAKFREIGSKIGSLRLSQ